MNDPLVTIVLVTRNGGKTLPATLDAIVRQRVDFSFEIVAVDSGSVDETLSLLERAKARVVRIAPDAFNHGATRNLAIEHARGALVVLLVQDALPASDDWLAQLAAPLRADPLVAGAFARQQPRPSATALTRHYQEQWVAAAPTARSAQLTRPDALDRLTPMERLRLCAFDNVCSCVRREVWQRIPFRETPIAEDLEWARAVLLAGHRLDFAATAVVLHSHERPAWYEFSRTYVLHRRLFELFGLRTIPTVRHLTRAVASTARLHLACERRAQRDGTARTGLPRALGLAVAWPLGQYLGGLWAARGWKPLRVGSV